ncbi:MAG: IscS subfamily cysteine desulfurase [Candidatus Tectomicrobia bacterium RIFCSPLOWO2_12_FULL_69_37]|nr:MAG: IscS subfamily cysteine desulfurase [Candidatus Tectomicrobia bacterium RIFCSPLOWO2_02_FULL_70_19]OGL62566.1 MAG: IscS subfamily cysteine desulfurase [Candidatus Tectomicrobia bacterium RIFCSPLOWO2_12_FULL_69_37]
MKFPIYMDYQATTPADPRVVEAMLPYFGEKFGNAASRNHSFGWEAEKAVDTAREQIAAVIGADPREIVFTSGATESDNMALKGVAEMYKSKGKHVVTSAIEHKAIIDSAKRLETWGFDVTYIEPPTDGITTAGMVRERLRDDTILVSIMAANNEVGVLNEVKEIGQLCRERGVLFHTDATQGYGKVPMNVDDMCIDLLSMSAHKIYGPKGIGALYVRRRKPRVRLAALIDGGGHERGMRSGTLNVTGIVGFGKAAELCARELEEETIRLVNLREKFKSIIFESLDEVYVNGHETKRLPGNLNVSFPYVEGESLIMGLKDVAVSSGSACTSASLEPSYVLKAMGRGDELAHSSIRFGLGRFTTEEEIEYVAEKTTEIVKRLREMSPLYEMVKEGVDLSKVEWQHH